ncbi:MAG: hypothetical protein COY38_03445 [Candidatus Aenigmarchaeota archaeon CG_4_10_14_0_8_um_filter_37_24]|nr:sugar phosphate isomerase/epimerase [Candidatus Aenigmarchaeota archaeon]OIN88482.1 MAG: hypothetical protein AUJ50_00765 [Candidatus Aenigmarchaeota archaeon CG1_02_38_14]PIV68776.1 MAG: hypothetical protein COS07_03010 [Candidatus Aenigmarchaeota archaeon CG01_land_8_20_14_3_00_37_9]PIW41605.1 MAG: hypothetical protein COW21_00935 [Candidatus Aenigmarchaeota archaeon CG15_BIG_FIL_POST_REV_8_21_14_020_37_27]PIX50955.1 MAG: hypothetical protein COZ52_01415 [Candidatus Aenigmarchaeota archaeo
MSLPKFGASTDLFKTALEGMKELQGYGFDFFEILVQEPFGTPGKLMKEQKEIIEFVKENNLFLLGHPPHWGEIASMHEGIRKAWVNEYKESIEISQKLGIKKLVVHPHTKKYPKGESFEEEMRENNIQSLTEINDYGKDHGVTIVLENVPRKESVFGFGDFKHLADNVDGLKVLIDIGHAHIYYGMDNVFKYLKAFMPKIDHLHFHDNYGEEDDHLPIGACSIDYKSVVEFLKKKKYDKTITFEIFTKDKDYASISMQKIKGMWGVK